MVCFLGEIFILFTNFIPDSHTRKANLDEKMCLIEISDIIQELLVILLKAFFVTAEKRPEVTAAFSKSSALSSSFQFYLLLNQPKPFSFA